MTLAKSECSVLHFLAEGSTFVLLRPGWCSGATSDGPVARTSRATAAVGRAASAFPDSPSREEGVGAASSGLAARVATAFWLRKSAATSRQVFSAASPRSLFLRSARSSPSSLPSSVRDEMPSVPRGRSWQ